MLAQIAPCNREPNRTERNAISPRSVTTRVYIEIANSLDAAVSSAVRDALYEPAERARSMFEISREELRRHEAEHGCILSRQAEPA
jgi:hypothetical protein